MNRRISSVLLLLILSITDAYLLAHPNLIGRLGVLLYKHTYIKNFPTALVTVLATVTISVLLCEGILFFSRRKLAEPAFLILTLVALGWLGYVYVTFSSFAYRITGKAFVYGAHLLPVILLGVYVRYLVKALTGREKGEQVVGPALQDEDKTRV